MLDMLDMLMAIQGHVAVLVMLICISGIVDLKDQERLVSLVCVGASEIQCLGL
jgi:hypothetical protein